MKRLKTIPFSIFINSDREKIGNVLWNPEIYEKWAAVFSEGSIRRAKCTRVIQFNF